MERALVKAFAWLAFLLSLGLAGTSSGATAPAVLFAAILICTTLESCTAAILATKGHDDRLIVWEQERVKLVASLRGEPEAELKAHR